MRLPSVCVAHRTWGPTETGRGRVQLLIRVFVNPMFLCIQATTWAQVSLSISGKKGGGGGGVFLPWRSTRGGCPRLFFLLLWHQQAPGRTGYVSQRPVPPRLGTAELCSCRDKGSEEQAQLCNREWA